MLEVSMLAVLIFVVVSWLARILLPPEQAMPHHQSTLSATDVAESPDFERESSSDAIQQAQREEIRPIEPRLPPPIGVYSNVAIASQIARRQWQPDRSNLGSPRELLNAV